MTERQTILNGLYAKRAEMEKERPTLEAEFARITERKRRLDEAIHSLDVVIGQFGGTIPSGETGIPEDESFHLAANGNGHRNSDDAHVGLKTLAKRHFSELPSNYIKNDVEQLLFRHRPGLTKINPNTLAGVLRYLCEKNFAKIKIPAVGRSPQVYEKVED